MKTITKLRLLFLLMLSIALGSAATALWHARHTETHVQRLGLAHEVYEAHLSLSNHTYQLFKEYGDALIIGDQDRGVDEAVLATKIRADIERARRLISGEIDVVGIEEVGELDRLNDIERKLEGLIVALDRISGGEQTFQDGFPSSWSELSQVLDDDIDRDFYSLIQAALAEEAEEVEEAQETVDYELAFHRTLMAITALTAIAALAVCYILLQKMISQPIDHLLVGIERFSEGDLSQPIGLEGRDEFAEIGKTLDLMAKRLGERTNLLASQNADLEQVVAERTSRLEHLLADMRRSEASRRRMLADVSHELRTPLTLIRGEADIALRGEPKTVDVYQEALTKVREASEHTAHLVDDLLFMARNESGHARLRIAEIDLKELLAELPQNGGRHAQFVTDLETAPMQGDADRLRQVLLILLENARHYGGNTITMRLDHSPDGYRLAVEDDGPGMSDTEKENAFTRYFRGTNAAERYASGVGLGLPVARSIVEAHGGTIMLEDHDDGGLVAAITLPKQRPLRAVS